MATNPFAFQTTAGASKDLNFVVKRFNLKGELMSVAPLTSQLSLCHLSNQDISEYRRFGGSFSKTCSLSISHLFNKQEQYFYELFLQLANGSYVDVPVVFADYRNANQQNPNADRGNFDNFLYSRRYFLVDSVSGVEGTTEADLKTKVPLLIRILSKATLYIKSFGNKGADDPSQERLNNGILRKPYVYLEYRTIEATKRKEETSCKFEVIYAPDRSDFDRFNLAMLITFNVVAALITVFKMIIWYMYNPPQFLPENFLSKFVLRFLINLYTIWSFCMFWYLLSVTGYWFVFYKWQNFAFIFMPTRDEDRRIYFLYRIVFWLMFGGLMLQAFVASAHQMLVYDQSEYDFFFLDWERNKYDTIKQDELRDKMLEEDKRELELKRMQLGGAAAAQNADVATTQGNNQARLIEAGLPIDKIRVGSVDKKSAWRNLVIANEFNELFGERYINFTFVFLLYGVIMSGYRYENWSVTIPFLTREVDYRSQNYVLKFFVSSALLVIIGGVYYSTRRSPVIRKLVVLKVATPAMNFADLCSVANISVFIFESFCHGYYIHGVRAAHAAQPGRHQRGHRRGPQGGAHQGVEGQLAGQRPAPERREGPPDLRNIHPAKRQTDGRPQLQLPRREQHPQPAELRAEHGLLRPAVPPSNRRLFSKKRLSLPGGINYARLEGMSRAVAGYLKSKIEAVVSQANSNILEKSAMYRMTRIPPVDLVSFGKQKSDGSKDDTPIFIKDPEHSFDNVMSFGHDFKVAPCDRSC